MSSSLFSQNWYKVSDVKVRLRNHTSIHRHIYRGQVWFVLQDHVTGHFQRFSPQAYHLIGLMNGEHTLQEIWDSACESLGEDIPTQDQVIQLLSQLNRANAIQTDKLPDIESLQHRRIKQRKSKLLQQLKSPLSIKVPLVDPEGFLSATSWVANLLFSRLGALVWFVVVMTGLILAGLNWEELVQNASDRVLSVDNLLVMAMVYPVVKLVHELGHGYAVKRWGGEVHEMGVMLLIFIPVPYVDATAASSFHNKYQKMMVGGVGVLGEVFMAAIAMIVWSLAEPGITRAVAFNVMLIGGVSTVLFNGNPLLRFDAYYVLADYLEIPNLASRGNSQVGYLVKRYAFGMTEVKTQAKTNKESFWLVSYATLSYVYRLFVMVAISLFVATKYLFVGTLLAIWSVWTSLLLPVFKLLGKPMTDPNLKQKQSRVLTISSVFLLLVFGFLWFVPIPHSTQTEGVLYVPQESHIRTSVSGFVKEVRVEDGEMVQEGQIIYILHAPDLSARAKVLAAQLKEARLRYEASIQDVTEAEILLQELNFIENEVSDIEQRLLSLEIRSPVSGQYIVPSRVVPLARYVNRGDSMGYVINYDDLPLATLIPEDYVELVDRDTLSVSLKIASLPKSTFESQILRRYPSSSKELISEVLSIEGGGAIALDPNSEQGMETFQNYFRVELDSRQLPKTRYDERVYVQFEHSPEPIAWRWYRNVRRVFLRQFDV